MFPNVIRLYLILSLVDYVRFHELRAWGFRSARVGQSAKVVVALWHNFGRI